MYQISDDSWYITARNEGFRSKIEGDVTKKKLILGTSLFLLIKANDN